MPNQFDTISPTALGPTFLRAESGIKYAKEIAHLLGARDATATLVGGAKHLPLMQRSFAAWAELRLRSLSAAVGPSMNVLELAAGFSPLGLLHSTMPDVYYVASDLPGMFNSRQALMTELQASRRNLVLCSVDATSNSDMMTCAKLYLLGRGRVNIACEGFLSYLTHEQKLQVAENVRVVLDLAGGGAWHTSDIHTKEEMRLTEDISRSYLGNFEQKTGRSFVGMAFDSLDEAEELMRTAGLKVRRHEQLDFVPLGSLVSPVPDDAQVLEMLKHQHLWIISRA